MMIVASSFTAKKNCGPVSNILNTEKRKLSSTHQKTAIPDSLAVIISNKIDFSNKEWNIKSTQDFTLAHCPGY